MLRRADRVIRRFIGSVGSGIAFPSSIQAADIAAWMDGNQIAYSDAGATTPVSSGLVRRINEAAAIGGNWVSSSDPQRPNRDPAGLRFELFGSASPGTQVQRTLGTVLGLNDTTMIVSFISRDGYGGPVMGLCGVATPNLGIYGGGSGSDSSGGAIGAYVNGGSQGFSNLIIPRAQPCTVAMRWTPTAVRCDLLTGGKYTTQTVAATITGGSIASSWFMANAFAGQQGFYGSISQFIAINHARSDAETFQAMTWCAQQYLPPGYPTTTSLIGVAGDSIARVGVGATANQGWPWIMLSNLRGGSPGVEMANVAIVGSGVGPSTYANLTPLYSAARAKNVVFLASGTNDMANNNPVGPLLTAYYAACDTLRAQGWIVIACTVLPRSDAMVATQLQFNTARATFNADIVANYASHAAGLANVAAITGMGADGDSNNATNYNVDKIHPTAAGHALLEPVYRAAASALL